MRVALILIIGVCLLWVVSKGTRDAQGADREQPAEQSGYLLPADDSTPVEGRQDEAPVAASEGTTDNPSEPVHVEPRAPASVEKVVELPTAVDGGVWLELAAELAHRPASMSQLMAARAHDLPADRVELATACMHLSLGEKAKARTIYDNLKSSDDAVASRLWLLADVAEGRKVRALSDVPKDDPLMFAGWIGLRAADAKGALDARRYPDAARAYSDLLLAELDAPWEPERASLQQWTDGLRLAQARYRWNSDADWPSIRLTVAKGESLIAIRKRALAEDPNLLICTGMIERANAIRGAVLQPGQKLRIPSERAHMLVDLSAHWAVYMFGDEAAVAWEVGVGGAGSETRPGAYVVGDKSTEPMWFPQGKAPVPFGDPANPLGTRWIAWLTLDGTSTRLGFHGTKDPASIGKDQSQGCIRMRNEDVEELFEILPKGAAVTVRP